MLRFSEWLQEVQFKKGTAIGPYTGGLMDFTFYKNPSAGEIKLTGPDARGIVSSTGDLYLMDQPITSNFDIFVHDDIIQMLSGVVKMGSFAYKQFHNTKFTKMDMVPIQRKGKTILISESMQPIVLKVKTQIAYVKKLFETAKKKNSFFNFKAISIDQYSGK